MLEPLVLDHLPVDEFLCLPHLLVHPLWREDVHIAHLVLRVLEALRLHIALADEGLDDVVDATEA